MFYYIMESAKARIGWYIFTALILMLFIYSVKKEARRFANCVLLAISVCSLWQSIVIYIGFSEVIDIAGLSVTPTIILLLAIGVGLIINGIIIIKKEGMSLAHALPILLGICIGSVLFGFVFCITQFASTDTGYTLVQRFLSAFFTLGVDIILYFPILLLSFYGYSFLYQRLPKRGTADFILVLGCGLCKEEVSPILGQRLDKGIEYYNRTGKKSMFVVSGGQGKDELVPEAVAMKNYLCQQGIPEDRILMEEQSTTTRENMMYSKRIMKQTKRDYKAVFITNNYHVLRSAILAKNIGLRAQGIGCKTAGYYRPAAAIREGIAIIVSYRRVFIGYVVLCLITFVGNLLLS